MTTDEHLNRIKATCSNHFDISPSDQDAVLESLTAVREQISEMQRMLRAQIATLTTERNAAVILLRAKTDTATWEKYPESLQEAVEAEYARITTERECFRKESATLRRKYTHFRAMAICAREMLTNEAHALADSVKVRVGPLRDRLMDAAKVIDADLRAEAALPICDTSPKRATDEGSSEKEGHQ